MEYTVAIIGPGTGLGISGLHKQGDSYTAISGEASHSGFAPEYDLQVEILSALRRKFDRVSIERVVSGPGLENIYWALSRIRNEKRAQLSAAEIFAKVNDASDPLAVEAVQLFFEILGQVAGDIALAFGAEDGVFIAGGIVRRYAELLADSRFRSGFESKGRHRPILQRIPTQLILHEQPGLLGASCCALELLDIDIRTGERVQHRITCDTGVPIEFLRPSMEPKVKSYFEVIEKIDTAEDYSDAQKRAQLSLSELMTKHQKSLITLGLV